MNAQATEPQAEEQRKAVITVTEGENIDVTIELLPGGKAYGTSVGANIGMSHFQAIAEEFRKHNVYSKPGRKA